MIHEITISDRLRASIAALIPTQKRTTCEREGRESHDEQIAIADSCSVCGDPPGYCDKYGGCGKNVCVKHRTLNGLCLDCAKSEDEA